MNRAIFLLLVLTTAVCGQQRDLKTDRSLPIPGPGSAGTVTLSLAEYNRLSELAATKPKQSDAPPLPYALSRTAFKLRVQDHSIVGTVNIDGAVLNKGATRVPLTTGLTVLEAKQAGNALPLLQESGTHAAILSGPAPFSVTL